MPIDPARVKELFLAALDLPPEGRAAFLDRVCGPDAALRARLDELLAHHVSAPPDNSTGSYPDATHIAEDGTHSAAIAGDSTRSTPTTAEAVGTVIAGRYKLLQQIGEGGMGTVWMADQTEPVKRRVAVKLIRTERGNSKTILSRFEAERQAIALMDHPHIAKLLDAGAVEGAPFFVMELVKGVPLTDYCDAHRLSIPDRLTLFTQICSAVQHAHQKGVIHRDLKPSNILVESHDGKPMPKVIDFGLAKATSGLQLTENTLFTGFGSVMGTPLYMAPEQATFNAVDVDTRADIYALGVILYELLTGTTPLTRDTVRKAALDEMLRLVREQEAPTPSSRLSSSEAKPTVAANRQTEPAKLGRFVKGELDWIVLKALSKDRERRYETANGFAKDVERFLNHEPVTAGPVSAGYKLKKFVQRNRGAVVGTGLVLLTLLFGIAGTALGLVQANRSAAAERDAKLDAQDKERLAVAAADKERTANQLAQARLGQVERGSDLLLSIFTDLDPRVEDKEGKPLRAILSDRIDKVVGQLEGESVSDPLTVAKLQNRLGVAQQNLGEFKRAIPLLTAARRTREAALGPDHPDTLESRTNLAEVYTFDGRAAEAIAMERETLELHVARQGPDHPATLTSRNTLAEAYRAAGQVGEAIPLFEETLRRRVAKLGPDDRETLATRSNLGHAYLSADRVPEAIPLFEDTLKRSAAKLGPDDIDTLVCRISLAAGYRLAGRLPEAIAMHEETLKLSAKKLGPDHHLTLVTRINLASAYRFAGRAAEAVAMNEETAKLSTVKLGPDHPETLAVRHNLGESYKLAGRPADAIPVLEETLKLRTAKLTPDHPDTVQSGLGLAEAYEMVGRWADAEPHRREVVARRRKAGGPPLGRALADLGRTLLRVAKWTDAEDTARESVTILSKVQPDDWWRFHATNVLGGALAGQKKYTDAEPLLVQGYEGLKQRAKAIPPPGRSRLPESIDRLIELYTATNKPDEVAKWRAERAKYRETLPQPRKE